MEKSINKITLFLLGLILLTSCDNFDRTEAIPAISVNHTSLSLFIGDDIQLTASPQNNTSYKWESEDIEVATITSDGIVTAVGEGTTNIIVRDGDIQTSIPITVVTLIPLTSVELSTDHIAIFPNTSEIILVDYTPIDANEVSRTDFKWWSDDESIAIVYANGKILGMKEGFTKVHYQKGKFLKTVLVDVVSSLPFKGPHILSKKEVLTLPLRNFDLGGEGNAYHDSDATNSAGANYRQDNGDPNSPGVDIEGGGNIGYVNADEWLVYTVEVEDAGVYAVQLGASGPNDTGSFHIQVDDIDKTGLISVPPTGGWSKWTWFPTVAKELTLTEGKHKIKLYINKSGFNINELRFEFLNSK